MTQVQVPTGERKRVMYIWSSSIPGSIRFTAKTKSGKAPSGLVETTIRRVFAGRTTEYPLQAENTLTKGMFDSSYQIFVTPDEETTITFHSRHFQKRHLMLALGIVIGIAVVSTLIPLILR